MSVQQQIDRISTEVSAQETLLDQALAAIANKAAGGGGGGSVETCTVKITGSLNIYSAGATVYKDGAISDYIEGRLYAQDITELTIENVVCNSVVSFYGVGGSIPAASGENAEVTLSSGSFYVKVTAPAGGTSTITTYDAD